MEFFKVKEPVTKMEETLAWGFQAGCSVVQDGQTCNDIPMVCQKNGNVCSPDYFSIGSCQTSHSGDGIDLAAGGCHVFRETIDCRYQVRLNSRCIEIEVGS
jgi:hypothetical protein